MCEPMWAGIAVTIWPAIIGGALFGAPSLAQLVLLKRGYPYLPTSWRVIGIYAEAIFHGVGAGMAGYFVGYGIRAYWGVT
jgi:hypothetical protein